MNTRATAFIAVGAVGFTVQLAALAALTMAAGMPYEPATAIAVELAVLHNFIWHERWTWRDRTYSRRGMIARFARFQISNGFTSLVGNLVFMAIAIEIFRMNAMAANAASVVLTSVVNFLMADRWVFTRGAAVAATIAFAAVPSPASAAELKAETIAAWNQYVTGTEARWRSQRVSSDEPSGVAIPIPGGTIHDWRGSIVIRGTTVDALIDALMHPGTQIGRASC